jgi:hypothetical protein
MVRAMTTPDRRRYGRLSDWLYKFVSKIADIERADWGEREDIKMALRFIKRLERLHEKEAQEEQAGKEWERQQRLKEKRSAVVKLVAPDNKDAS